jgi:hypothetical protein
LGGSVPVPTSTEDHLVAKTLAAQAGTTPGPGIEDPLAGWRQYASADESGIYIDVVTSVVFDEPVYVASLTGTAYHWLTTGGSSIYPTPNVATKDGFRVYVRFSDGRPVSPQVAVDNGWRVNWIAMRHGLLLAPEP